MNQFQDEKAKLLEALAHESNQPQNNKLQQLKDKVQSQQAHADLIESSGYCYDRPMPLSFHLSPFTPRSAQYTPKAPLR